MKKLISILISLLFVASTFGVAQTMAEEISLCDYCYGGPDNITVQVGDTLLVNYGLAGIIDSNPHFEPKVIFDGEVAPGKYLQVIDYGFFIHEITTDATNLSSPIQSKIKALQPGTINLAFVCIEPPISFCLRTNFTVTIMPKPLPMDQITNILEKNRCKNHPNAEGCEVN